MSDFSKVDRPLVISNTPGGVWKIEKKRKARDKKNKHQNKPEKEQKIREDREDDDSVLVEIEHDRADNKECEDQMGYGFIKKKKSLCPKVDLKI
ncbi:MAG: hypothetical protein PVG39_01025 [Desulfobacteraceae bacterium]|jgi:hypothetical protein